MCKVSLIIPVHNTENYLEKCLDSVLCQTLTDIEIILVENGSTDRSLELCLAIAQRDSRVKVIQLAEGDLSTARNVGVSVATSSYVGFVDSDDTVLPEMYEEMYHLAIQHNLELVCCNFVYKYDGKPDKYPFKETREKRILTGEAMLRLNFQEMIPKTACTMLYKKNLFEHVRFPEKMYFEDRASTFLFISQCKYCGYIDTAYYSYYQRTNSISHDCSYLKHRDYILSDCIRLAFIRDCELFSTREKAALSYKSSNTLVRRLRKLSKCVQTTEQRDEFLLLLEQIALIPNQTRLSFSGYISFFYLKILARLLSH